MYSVNVPESGLKLPTTMAPWTSVPDIISTMALQYDVTLSKLREFQSMVPRDNDARHRGQMPTEQMEREDTRLALEENLVALAEMLCKICVERVTWCRALAEDEGTRLNAEDIWKQYIASRGGWIKPLGIFLLILDLNLSHIWKIREST